MVPSAALRRRIKASLNTTLQKFLGGFEGLQILEKKFPAYEVANISIALKEFFEQETEEAQLLGLREGDWGPPPLSRLLASASVDREGNFIGFDENPPVYEKVVTDSVDSRLGLRLGVALFRYGGDKMLAYCVRIDQLSDPLYALSVVARDLAKANQFVTKFMEYENRRSIFRGKVIRPKLDYTDKIKEAEIIDHVRVGWNDLALPDELGLEIRENVIGYIECASRLMANGIEAKRGVLFHGPPGTGKTLACRVLASSLAGFTTILCTGENLTRPSAVFELARRYQPALILFEDIDLVGGRRDDNPLKTVLTTLMNELDGVQAREQVYCIFTTNCIEALEPGLSQRPGRIDLIIRFPLPGRDLRERLIRQYAGRAELRLEHLETVVEQTDGATPAFLKELVKRAVSLAVRRGSTNGEARAVVTDEHLQEALRILKSIEDQAARKIIGF